MKKVMLILFLVSLNFLMAQDNSPRKAVEEFFVAFHKKDTIALRSISHSDIVMQTIVNTKEGTTKLLTEQYANFLKSISGIPNEMKFEEKLLDFQIQIDANLAHVWTPYEFYVNDTISHKGANSFTLINENGIWKIVHVIDTTHK